MQRVKNADRRLDTRAKIILGGLVLKAGAGDLSEDELLAVLRHYMEQGPEPGLKAFVQKHGQITDDQKA